MRAIAISIALILSCWGENMTIDQSMKVESSLRNEINQRIAADNKALKEGGYPATSYLSRIMDDFMGVQYADHYSSGVFRGGKSEWAAGTDQAAKTMSAHYDRWEVHGLRVLVRSGSEAIASYEIWAVPKAESSSIPKAFFLETYVQRHGSWFLKRHHAEKVSGKIE